MRTYHVTADRRRAVGRGSVSELQHDAHPYGLGGSGVTAADLKTALTRPVLVLLGEADIDPNHRPMPRTPEANAQGLHRFSRGLNYFRLATEQTVRLGVPFGPHERGSRRP